MAPFRGTSHRMETYSSNGANNSFGFSHLATCFDSAAESRQAIDTALTLVKRSSIPLEVITVNSPGVSEMRDHDELRAAVISPAIQAQTVVLHGNDVAATIAAHLDTLPSPLLCMASRGRGALGAAALGSVSERILRITHHPVLLVGPHARAITSLSHTLLVCLDGSDASAHILPAAHAWASTFGNDVLVLHDLGDSDDRHTRVAHAQVDHAVTWFRERSIAASGEFAYGASPEETIAETARRFGISAVAMTTRARTPLRRLEFGSVAMHVLREASRSVLIVNPNAS